MSEVLWAGIAMACAIMGYVTGFVRGVHVRAEKAVQLRNYVRKHMQWLSVTARRAQERRAKLGLELLRRADEPENR